MCLKMQIPAEEIRNNQTWIIFKGQLIIQEQHPSLAGFTPTGRATWQGWINEDFITEWLDGGWKRCEIFASKFNQAGRWYDIPPGEIIKGIAFQTEGTTIVKVVMRESKYKEKMVYSVFPKTSKRILKG